MVLFDTWHLVYCKEKTRYVVWYDGTVWRVHYMAKYIAYSSGIVCFSIYKRRTNII